MNIIRRIKWYFINRRYRDRFITYIEKGETVLYGSLWDDDCNWIECLIFRTNGTDIGIICLFDTGRFEPIKNTLYSNFIIDKNMDQIR